MNYYKQLVSKFSKHYIVAKQMNKATSEMLTLRLADHSDYVNMVQLSQEGNVPLEAATDYIPGRYNWLMNTGNLIPCLVLANEKPVLCAMYYLMSNGTEVLGLGARTLPQYQGQGLFHFMGRNMEPFLIKELPYIKRFLTVGEENQGRKRLMEKAGVTAELKFNYLFYDMKRPNDRLPDESFSDVHELTHVEANALFSQQNNFKVFSGQRFACSKPVIPYSVTQDNIMTAAQMNRVFVTYDSNPVIKAITFANGLTVPSGAAICLYYYGICDKELLERHFITALKTIYQNLSWTSLQKVTIILYVPQTYDVQDVHLFMKKYNIGPNEKEALMNMFEYTAELWKA